MNEHLSDRSGAYVSRPRGKSGGPFSSLPVGAGVAAAAAGLVFLLAPGFQAPQAPPPAPASAKPAAPAVPAAAVSVAAAAAPSVRAAAPAVESVKVPTAARPSWAGAKDQQTWLWPRHLSIRNDEGTIHRKLIGWFPANPEAKRLLYSLTVDRVETRLYEDEIAAFESRLAAEAEARRLEEAAAAARKAEALAQAQAMQAAQANAAAVSRAQQGLTDALARQNREREEAAARAEETAAAGTPAPARTKAPPTKRRPTASRVGQIALAAPAPAAVQAAAPAAASAPAAPGAALFTAAMVEAWMKEIRKHQLNILQAKRGAVQVRDVSVDKGGPRMAELTYADGRKEVVPYDPLVFDLKGTGIKTSPKKVLFDLYGYGKNDKAQWMNDLDENAGILVFDADGSGDSGKNGGEVFGDRTDLAGVGRPTGFVDGFQALRALVLKAVDAGVLGRDVLDHGILDASALAALEKAYGLKMKPGGFNRKAVSLASLGIKSIALSLEPTQRAPDFDGQGNDLVVQPGAVFLRADGTTGSYMNVWLKAQLGNLGLTTVARLDQR